MDHKVDAPTRGTIRALDETFDLVKVYTGRTLDNGRDR